MELCLGQVLEIDIESQMLGQLLPATCFLLKNGLLHYRCPCHRGPENLLVVPQSKIDTVIHPVHTHLLVGHLEAENTFEKIRDHVHFYSMVAKVRNFV